MKITLEKRGCDFFSKGKYREGASDIGNYRVCTLGYVVPSKMLGTSVFVEFTFGSGLRFENKRTGLPLKHPIHDKDYECNLAVDIAFENARGCFRPIALEAAIHTFKWKYTKEGLLHCLNYIAGEVLYDEIEFVD